jgi:hypothetical protein
VYVELEAAPWVLRLDVATADRGDSAATSGGWSIRLPGERLARYRAAWLDEHGRLFLDCDLGFGLVHSLDTDVAALAIEAGDWQPGQMEFARMPGHFGYVLRPQADSRGT